MPQVSFGLLIRVVERINETQACRSVVTGGLVLRVFCRPVVVGWGFSRKTVDCLLKFKKLKTMALSKLSSSEKINCVALTWAAKQQIRKIYASCCRAQSLVDRFCDACYDVYIQMNEIPVRKHLYERCRDIFERFFNNLPSVEFQQAIRFIEDIRHRLADNDRCQLIQFFEKWYEHFGKPDLSRQMFNGMVKSNFFDLGIVSLRVRRETRRRGCQPIPPRPTLPTFVLDRGVNHGEGFLYIIYRDISNSKYVLVYEPMYHDWSNVFKITIYETNANIIYRNKGCALRECKYMCTARSFYVGNATYFS
ncbi:uncharacterized protein LOC127833334 isoform X1 [Dreissena polymorpha]|uniref:uncharacterized protein LOC127833334 isoform X1 n=1 Tax=Dreissena polymorpha TaxID=45954 RepID=UPI002264AC78|nr:uncharacterized protein LOC127833334 isoform X1 [Dreissena polymorpha]